MHLVELVGHGLAPHHEGVEGEQHEEEATDPAGGSDELQGHGMVVLVQHLHLGTGQVDDGEKGEVAGVGPAARQEKEGAKDKQDNAKDDAEEVEPGAVVAFDFCGICHCRLLSLVLERLDCLEVVKAVTDL